MVRVLIVDDSVFMRTVLKDILGRDPSLEVVGTAADGKEALKKIVVLKPDVMTLDIQMPQMDGIATLEAMRSLPSVPKTLMLSTLTTKDADLTRRALDLGADDFLLEPGSVTVIEWAERVEEALPAAFLWVFFFHETPRRRRIRFEGRGAYYDDVLKRIWKKIEGAVR